MIAQICFEVLIVPVEDSPHTEFQVLTVKGSRVMTPGKGHFVLILSIVSASLRFYRIIIDYIFRKYSTGTLRIQSLKVPAQRGPELWPL